MLWERLFFTPRRATPGERGSIMKLNNTIMLHCCSANNHRSEIDYHTVATLL